MMVVTWLRPKEPIPFGMRLLASVSTVVALAAVWCVLAYGGLVREIFLPTPHEVASTAGRLTVSGELAVHIGASAFVIVSGFVLSSIIAVPVGILMGSFALVEAVLEPLINFVRYLPASAMIPLLILWVGIGPEEKIAVIFIGTFFQQVILIADISAHVSRDLIDVSYTLGAEPWQVFSRVLVPATLPGIMDTLRTTMGWAWTYLVVAELVAASRGLGYLIMNAQRGLFTDRIFVGIMVIGLLGYLSDQTFKYLHRWLLPWSPKAG